MYLFVIQSVPMKILCNISPCSDRGTISVYSLCQMLRSWPIPYNAMALHNLLVVQQYRYSCLCSSLIAST